MASKKIGFDIESVPQFKTLHDAPEDVRNAWRNWAKPDRFPDIPDTEDFFEVAYEKKAALYPEFGQVVVISVMTKDKGLQTFAQESKIPLKEREKDLLFRFSTWLGGFADVTLIGHYIKKFDVPYVAVRCVANALLIPVPFRTFGKKPWDLKHLLDTWEIWKGGIYGTSQAATVEVICSVLNIQSPKTEFSGGDVAKIFFSGEPDSMDKIVKYCERDVLAAMTMLRQMKSFGMF